MGAAKTIDWRAVLLAALLLSVTSKPAAAQPSRPHSAQPQRVVSLNLCADQLLLALADRNQIAGLTRNARDPEMSAAADAARGIPILGGSAEEVLAIRPDLIVGMPARRNPAIAVLKAQKYQAVDLKPAGSYRDIIAAIRQIASAVGHPERGEALVARMDADLARLPKPQSRAVAAYYQRRGYITGTGTLIDDLMQRVGMVNLAFRLRRSAVSRIGLEEIFAASPDFLIVDRATDRVSDQGTEMLHHPALKGIARISIPQAWTVCGGPAYVRAAQALSVALSTRRPVG